MYDAFNITVNATGDTTGYWDINLLRTSDGAIARLMPPQPPGIDLGNAVFASNTDNIIAFDFVDENRDVTVLGVNLNSGDTGQITFNFKSLGSPTFSNDDSKVYYHFVDQNGAAVWVVDLAADGITGAGNDQGVVNGGFFPVAYTVGARPTSVEDKTTAVPTEFTLSQNYPNPFNPSTTIQFTVPTASNVTIKIYDILGREVASLVDDKYQPGQHKVVFEAGQLASGVYVYRIQAGNYRKTKKLILLK